MARDKFKGKSEKDKDEQKEKDALEDFLEKQSSDLKRIDEEREHAEKLLAHEKNKPKTAKSAKPTQPAKKAKPEPEFVLKKTKTDPEEKKMMEEFFIKKEEKAAEPEIVLESSATDTGDSSRTAKKVMLDSVTKKRSLSEEAKARPADKKRAKQVDMALGAAEQLYTGTRKVTRETIDFAGDVGKGSVKLVSSVVGGAFGVVGWGLLGVVRIAGIGYRGAVSVTTSLGRGITGQTTEGKMSRK